MDLRHWNLRKRLTAAFVTLQVVAVGAGGALLFLAWRESQVVRHIQEVAWPMAEVAMEARILLLQEDLELARALQQGVARQQEVAALYDRHIELLATSQPPAALDAQRLERLSALERRRHEQIEAVWPLLRALRTDGSEEARQRCARAMADLEATTGQIDGLLQDTEGEARQTMARLGRLASGQAHVGVGVLFLLGVTTFGLTECFRRLTRRFVSAPVERMAAEIESVEGSHGAAGRRLSVPTVPELGLLAQTVNHMLARVEEGEAERRRLDHHLIRAERMASIGVAASGIVHNLRNPLTAILGYGQLLQLENPDREDVGRIVEGAQQMVQMVQDILDRSPRKGISESVDLNAVLARELDFLKSDPVFKHRVEKQVRLAEDLRPVAGTQVDFSQVFGNLLRNAVDAMYGRETMRLVVRTANENEHVVVEIADTGCGIPEADRPRLFEPFYTTKPGVAADGGPVGTGLGLYTVRHLLAGWRGTIAYESQVGVGTTFRVRFPVTAQVGEPGA